MPSSLRLSRLLSIIDRQAPAYKAAGIGPTRGLQFATPPQKMESSIREAAQEAQNAERAAHEASTCAQSVVKTVSEVRHVSDEISAVILTINSITYETNLLALNASIEAARAGASGQSFAVVADEVKDLAQKTERALADVSQMVKSIQDTTDAASDQTARMAELMETISNSSAMITSAIEQEATTTRS